MTEIGPLGVSFEYDGELEDEDAEIILEKMRRLMKRVVEVAELCPSTRRRDELVRFASTLDATFYGFDLDFFEHGLERLLRATVRRIKASFAVWPRLLEICDPNARKRDLPQTRLASSRS